MIELYAILGTAEPSEFWAFYNYVIQARGRYQVA